MKAYPHDYRVAATAAATGDVILASAGLAELRSAPPREFDGPGDRWSPETLLVAAISDCFVLTFRALARANGVAWQALDCEVTGTLARDQGRPRFTRYLIAARLSLPAGADFALARATLEKAEHGCLVSRSLNGETRLEIELVPASAAA